MLTPRLAAALIVAGIVLRLGFLATDSFWLDEAYSVAAVQTHSALAVWHTSVDPNHPPLYFVILRATLRLAGTSETTARLPSALASICSLGLLFVLARRLGLTRGAALTAVVLQSLSPVDIWYAQEARMYAMVTAFALAFAVALTLNSWRGSVLAVLTLTAGLYVDFTMVPLSAALISLWLVRWWHTDRRPARLALVATAWVAAWVAFQPRWPHLHQVLGRIDTVPLFVRLREAFGLPLAPGAPAIGLALLLVVLTGVAAALLWRAIANSRARAWWGWLVFAGFAATTVLLVVPRAYSVKQFLATGWPFVVLVVGWALTDGDRADTGARTPQARMRFRLPVTVGVSLIAAVVTVATPRADWRGVVAYLNGRQPRTEVVWLDPAWNAYAYEYYRPAVRWVASPVVSVEAPANLALPAGEVCVIAQRFGKSPPTSPTEAWLDRHARLLEAVSFARLQVRCYGPPFP